MADEKMFSCNCFFDLCVLSHYEKDNFQKLHSRIDELVTNKKFVISRNCLCSNCYCSFVSKRRSIWTLREINPNANYNASYVLCTNYASFILSKIFICEYDETKMNLHCQRRNAAVQSIGTFPCCYNYFCSKQIDLDWFCVACKLFLCSLKDFKLNEIKIVT